MADPLVEAADAISSQSPNVRAFAQLAAERIIALEGPGEPPPQPPVSARNYVFFGGSSPTHAAMLAPWEAWFGKTIDGVKVFGNRSTWALAESVSWLIQPWSSRVAKLITLVMLAPSDTGTLALGAAGAFDGRWLAIAKNLKAAGFNPAKDILRIGEEFNGTWEPWSPFNTARNGGDVAKNKRDFVAYYRRIVGVVRGVIPDAQFCWCPEYTAGAPVDDCYAGNDVVGYVGLDLYDRVSVASGEVFANRWHRYETAPAGLLWLDTFTGPHGIAAGKPICFPEAGNWGQYGQGPNGFQGGDEPQFWAKLADYIAARPGRVGPVTKYEDNPGKGHGAGTGALHGFSDRATSGTLTIYATDQRDSSGAVVAEAHPKSAAMYRQRFAA